MHLSELLEALANEIDLRSRFMATPTGSRWQDKPGYRAYSIHGEVHKQAGNRRNSGVASIYLLKPKFQDALRPAARALTEFGLTANQVTLFAGGLSLGFGLLLAPQPESRMMLVLLPVLLFVRMALNAIDGMMAREFGQKTALGACLNELGDVVSDAFLYLPFAFWAEFDSRWMAAVILLAVISEMAGVVAVMAGASRRYDGPMGKSDRAFVFGALALWRAFGWSITPWAAYVFSRLMIVLLVITVVNRVRNGLMETSRGEIHGG